MTGAKAPPDRGTYTGERRVTVDLDEAEPFQLVRSWYLLRDAGAHEIEARVSSSGDGCHVRAWFDADLVDPLGVENLRYAAGDHDTRIEMDREHEYKPGQILFSRKGTGDGREPERAGRWHSDPWSVVDELRHRSDRFEWGGV